VQLRPIFVQLRPIINIYAAIIDDAAAGSEGADRGVDNRRDRRMIKLICRIPSCMDYALAKFVRGLYRLYTLISIHCKVCMNYALFYFCEL
jgi:hypothetical protein